MLERSLGAQSPFPPKCPAPLAPEYVDQPLVLDSDLEPGVGIRPCVDLAL